MNIKLSEEDYKEINYCFQYNIIAPKDIRIKVYKLCLKRTTTIRSRIYHVCNQKMTVSSFCNLSNIFPEITQENYKKHIPKAKQYARLLDSLTPKGWQRRIKFLNIVIKNLENGKRDN
jgi:hypothetical protein